MLRNAWLSVDFDPITIAEVQQMDDTIAEDRLAGKRLQFGTAGLRARMGAGWDRMNSLTVLQTTQGLAAHLEHLADHSLDTWKLQGVVIGFDGRYNSEKFANVAAAAFLARGIRVHLFGAMTPTPFTPYLVHKLGSLAGIQITASHNPMQDNGYKLFGPDGSQITPPTDSEIAAEILQNLTPNKYALRLLGKDLFLKSDAQLAFRKSKMLSDPLVELPMSVDSLPIGVSEHYSRDVSEDLCRFPSLNSESTLRFSYTATHGVGYSPVAELWKAFKLPMSSLLPVPKQRFPDPDFPTLAFPNPEEKGALDLALAHADDHDCDYVIANDPDADRFTAAERQRDGTWKFFTGDQLGVIFSDWKIQNFKEEPANGLLVTSVVSSRMLSALAARRGCRYCDTLTGFKYMASKSISERLREPRLKHLLAYEEAIGYQLTATVPDKDGISAACVWAEMCNAYRSRAMLVSERFEELQKELGIFLTNNSYFISRDPTVTDELFDSFRAKGYQLPDFRVTMVKDVTRGLGSDLPATPEAQMIQFEVSDDSRMTGVVTLRASGTEPKIKYYTEVCCESEAAGVAFLERVVASITRNFFGNMAAAK